jgi:deoxyribonuclease-1
MHVEYGLDLKGMSTMLKRWHVAEPPNTQERSRNRKIETLQGTSRFIDQPKLVDELG